MSLTLIGLLTILICGFVLLQGSKLAMMQTALALSLLGGSAAIALPILSGSTVQPAIVALAFLAVRCLSPSPGLGTRLTEAFGRLAFLGIFVAYGACSAMILPHIFAGSLDVTPLRPIPTGNIFVTYPLAFSSQNITSAVYLLATLTAALCALLACTTSEASRRIACTASLIGGAHAALGIASVALAGVGGWEVLLGFFRNGFYAQLDQTVEGVSRMTGIFPEASVFASYGFAWLVFLSELWLRNVEPRWTGKAALVLAAALALSTSTTGYIGLTAYALILTLRIFLLPGSVPLGKALGLIAGALVALAGVVALFVIQRQTAEAFANVMSSLTIGKTQSLSAMQRAFWARKGYEAFMASAGLGIGPGSFRSSSIVMAILGSTGIVGAAAMLAHVFRTFRPFRRRTYFPSGDSHADTAASASWAAFVTLIPAAFAAATPDPGLLWGFLCGIALGYQPVSGSHSTVSATRGCHKLPQTVPTESQRQLESRQCASPL